MVTWQPTVRANQGAPTTAHHVRPRPPYDAGPRAQNDGLLVERPVVAITGVLYERRRGTRPSVAASPHPCEVTKV